MNDNRSESLLFQFYKVRLKDFSERRDENLILHFNSIKFD